ncbi:hypothetical protein V8G54_011738 [Vigna mungo]|uniref:Uncharacterized protein n=1 Tax=Vigna mungo TaxID=3915 RepID=A0AAQ3NS60_VIGMU
MLGKRGRRRRRRRRRKASIAASFWALLELRVGAEVWKDKPLTVTVEVKRGSWARAMTVAGTALAPSFCTLLAPFVPLSPSTFFTIESLSSFVKHLKEVFILCEDSKYVSSLVSYRESEFHLLG